MRATVVALALAAGLGFHGAAQAQTVDTRGLVDRLDRLERDLNTLQSQVYRGQAGGGSSASAGAGGGGAVTGSAYGILDDRISALESQMQQLTGQVEKSNFNLSQLSTKIDRMQSDNDFRFKELESKAGIGPAPGAAAASPAGQPSAAGQPGPTALNAPAAGEGTMGSPPGFLAHPATGHPGAAPAAPAAAAQPALVGKTPQEQYDYAFGLLRNSDYDGANKAFQAFVGQHPQDPLAGNAMFWLGQIPYSQGQYDQAAVIFLDAYRKYPKSAKAGESLLKVGLAMSNLSKKKEACAALHRFTTEFPDAADNLRRQASTEKQKLGC